MPNPPSTQISDKLYLGDSKSCYNRKILEEHNITAMVSLTIGRWTKWNMPWFKEMIPESNHLFKECEDSMTQNLLPWLADIYDFIEQHLRSGPVLVHCDRGVSRSATVVIAYLMKAHHYDLATALAFVKGKRKIRPNDNFKEQLEVWGAVRGNIWAAADVPKAEYEAYLAKRAKRLEEAGLTGNEPIGITSLW